MSYVSRLNVVTISMYRRMNKEICQRDDRWKTAEG
jgi:hypothetical protein